MKGLTCLVVLVLAVLIDLGMSYLFMFLWNLIMPELFGLPVLTFWMSFAIVMFLGLVSTILGIGNRK